MSASDLRQKIILDRGRNLLVSAGAGTGKTTVLVERFLSMVLSGEARVSEVLALTFTDKAATEMKSRILKRLSEAGREAEKRALESASISTFHAFASKILKEHPLEAGVDPGFRVLEEEEADLFREQALDSVFEKFAAEKREIFWEILALWEEDTLRKSILKLVEAARCHGKSVQIWCADISKFETPNFKQEIRNLLEALGENELAKEFKDFAAQSVWDWDLIQDFREWMAPFSRRKKDKEKWTEIIQACRGFVASQVEEKAQKYRPEWEAMAQAFEINYQALKRQEGALDFGDLETKMLELFESQDVASRKLCERLRSQFRFILVDEFQDTSEGQARLVHFLASPGNLFFVGDLKQSIYGFRGASPEQFQKKEAAYQNPAEGFSVPLLENFRTQPPILDFIHRFFETLWKEDGFRFQPLLARTPEPFLEVKNPALQIPVEILVAEKTDDETLAQARLREAHAIADRIRAFQDEGIAYGDMVILFQAMTASAIYEQALKQAGIPYFVVSGRGFYHRHEIKDIMQLLAFLENPLDDIPLAAVFRSPMVRLSEDALYWLAKSAKSENEMTPLYSALQDFENHPHLAHTDKEKICIFKNWIKIWFEAKDRLSLAELLEDILDRTQYAAVMLADSQGVRRYANLKKLVDLAREAEERERMSLGAFVRRVQKLERREIRESEAQIEAERSGRVVRLMSVHAAKGMEFKVVFVADLGHEKRSSGSKRLLADPNLGFGFQIWNEKDSDWEESLSWIRLEDAIRDRERAEWKRLFYVALTRAKQRLILSGVAQPRKKTKDFFRDMNSWMDWVLAAQENVAELCRFMILGSGMLRHMTLCAAEKKSFRQLLESKEPPNLEELIPEKKDRDKSEAALEALQVRLSPIISRPVRAIDLSVSQLVAFSKSLEKSLNPDEASILLSEKPEIFSRDEEELMSAADFGTRIHRVLERLNFKRPQAELKSLIEECFRGSAASEFEEAHQIINTFSKSDFCQEIAKSKRVFRELPFVLNERHGRIHGVLDLVLESSNGDWTVVDYKTSSGSEEKSESLGYVTQILIYALALQRLVGTAPSFGKVYYLKNQKMHVIDIHKTHLLEIEQKLRIWQERWIEGHALTSEAMVRV